MKMNLQKILTWSLLILITGLGLAVRFYDLTDPPLGFHPARQYHGAIIARGIYTRMGGNYADWQWPLNLAQDASEVRIEPPILESLSALTYKVLGYEALWVARIYSILFWTIGGLALFFLTRSLVGEAGSWAAILFYFFLPYGVIASRSFQPDPLMTALTILSLRATYRWVKSSQWRWAIAAGVISGLAILSKQIAVFFVFGAAAGILLSGWGFRRLIRSFQSWIFLLLASIPVVIYNIYGVFIDGSLAGQYSNRFYLELWTDPGFYLRWLGKINETISLPVLLLTAFGLLLMKNWEKRSVLLGWLAGYGIYGMVFAHHISTHDYYHLPLVPMAALGMAAVFEWLSGGVIQTMGRKAGKVALILLLSISVIYTGYLARFTLKKTDYRSVPALVEQLSQEMGGPKTPVVVLMKDYGTSFYYYGYLAPQVWPEDLKSDDFVSGFEAAISGKKYFIVSDFATLETQPQLKQYLSLHYPVFFQDNSFLIYDLTRWID